MGQKVHPIGFRLGVFRDWDARWFARRGVRDASYGHLILEDIKIRRFLDRYLDDAEIAKVEIEKAGDNIRVIVHSARPGIVIGKKGQEIENLRKELARLLNRNSVDVSVQEVKAPELDATLVAKNIAAQLVRRINFKQAMKKAATATLAGGARGIKICCGGRLGGAEIAREEWYRGGSVPLHTLRANIDYGFAEAKTTYGVIGVRVWIHKGEFKLV